MNHSQIESAFEEFIASREMFAVMLCAEWGGGKTYLWEEHLKKIGTSKQKKIVYVSLFGLKTPKEFEQAIISDLLLSNKSNLALAKYLSGMAETAMNSWSEAKYASGMSNMLKTVANDRALKAVNDQTILVIDDFERCEMPSVEILSVINKLIHKQGPKVLILADQDRIEDQDYLMHREKVIRYQWKLTYEPSDFLDIIKKDISGSLVGFIDRKRADILVLMKCLSHYNFRTWMTSFSQLEKLFDRIDELAPFELSYGSKKLNKVGDDIKLNIFIYVLMVRFLMTHHHKNPEKAIQYCFDFEHTSSDEQSYSESFGLSVSQSITEVHQHFKGHYFLSVFEYVNHGYLSDSAFSEDLSTYFNLKELDEGVFIENWQFETEDRFESLLKNVIKKLEKGEVQDRRLLSMLYDIDHTISETAGVGFDERSLSDRWNEYLARLISAQGSGKPQENIRLNSKANDIEKEIKRVITLKEFEHEKNNILNFLQEEDFSDQTYRKFSDKHRIEEISEAFYTPEALEIIQSRIANLKGGQIGVLSKIIQQLYRSKTISPKLHHDALNKLISCLENRVGCENNLLSKYHCAALLKYLKELTSKSIQ